MFGPENQLNTATLFRSACTKPSKWALVYFCQVCDDITEIAIKVALNTIILPSFCDFDIVRIVWYFLFFIFLVFPLTNIFALWSCLRTQGWPHNLKHSLGEKPYKQTKCDYLSNFRCCIYLYSPCLNLFSRWLTRS